jgi:WhiB family redox-sensing transcriptional regulator
MTNFDMLLATLTGAPAFHGSRCRGRGHLYDEAAPGENPAVVEARHNQAIQLCSHCPALDRCRDYFDSLPARKRPFGMVVAGRVIQPRPKGRPRKENA